MCIFIVPTVVQFLGVSSLVRFGATCKSFRVAVSKEVARRKECIASMENEVARLIASMDDDKFYAAETLVYYTMRLIDNALPSISEMRDRWEDLDVALAYEWKETDCFFQERVKITALIQNRYHHANLLSLGGYEFCFSCGAACGDCDCVEFICHNCGEDDFFCICIAQQIDHCMNCGKRKCNCCGPGCTYRGDNPDCPFPQWRGVGYRQFDERERRFHAPTETLHGGSHLDHLPCCYNADEYGRSERDIVNYYTRGTLWKGSMRCRARTTKTSKASQSEARRKSNK